MATSGTDLLVDAPSPMKRPTTADTIDELLRRGYRYALSLSHDAAQSEELLQEACLRISRRGGPWHAGYLFKTIRNLLVDTQRAAARRPEQALSDEGPRAPTPDEPDFGADELASALAHLRLEDREMLFLAAVEGYTTAEIADLTGRPRGTVLSALHRAKKKLRELLDDEHGKDL